MRRRPYGWLAGLAILASVLVPSRILFPQSPRLERIAGEIAGTPAVWLEGNRRPMFQPENDQGPAPDSLKLENISLFFKPTEDQQADLQTLLDALQDPASPLYHQWLRPEQFGQRFGLNPADIAKVAGWLQSQGFTITQTARSRLWVSFSGTAAQLRSAFHTEIHYYTVGGKRYYGIATPAWCRALPLWIITLPNRTALFAKLIRAPNPTSLPTSAAIISWRPRISPLFMT